MEFAACDLEWSVIRGQGDNLDRIAFIPYPRVADFIRGESNNKDFPTSFHVQTTRKKKGSTKVSHKPKVDSTLNYIM